MEWWLLSLRCVYFMLPAYFANMAPVWFGNSFRWMAVPVDSNISLGGKPLFGPHKTVRGLVTGIVLAIAVAFIQHLLYNVTVFQQLSLTDYRQWGLLGLLMGSGALAGDLLKSFIKRRVGIEPGKPFIPFDQVDFVAGALLFSSLIVPITWEVAAVSFALSFILHIATNHAAFWMGIRKEKW